MSRVGIETIFPSLIFKRKINNKRVKWCQSEQHPDIISPKQTTI